MVSDIDFYRMLRYFTVLTHEHYELVDLFNEKFNRKRLPPVSMEEIMQNICDDFGLSYEVVLQNSKLESWYK